MLWNGNFDWLIDWWLIIFSFDEAIKIDPKFKEAWYSKGKTLENLKKYEDSVKW